MKLSDIDPNVLAFCEGFALLMVGLITGFIGHFFNWAGYVSDAEQIIIIGLTWLGAKQAGIGLGLAKANK